MTHAAASGRDPRRPAGRLTAGVCIIHLIRATLRYASRKYWDHLARDLKAIYTAPSVEAAWAAFEELEEKWGKPYPAIGKLWRAAWEEFIPFLAYTTWRSAGSCSPPTPPSH
jgi:transposase-like protein